MLKRLIRLTPIELARYFLRGSTTCLLREDIANMLCGGRYGVNSDILSGAARVVRATGTIPLIAAGAKRTFPGGPKNHIDRLVIADEGQVHEMIDMIDRIIAGLEEFKRLLERAFSVYKSHRHGDEDLRLQALERLNARRGGLSVSVQPGKIILFPDNEDRTEH